VKLQLDLHDIYNRGGEIDRALQAVIDEAIATKAGVVEIIPGKGSGALKKRVLRFLDRKDIKALYHRVEKDSHNSGRVFVHFRWNSPPPRDTGRSPRHHRAVATGSRAGALGLAGWWSARLRPFQDAFTFVVMASDPARPGATWPPANWPAHTTAALMPMCVHRRVRPVSAGVGAGATWIPSSQGRPSAAIRWVR